MAYLLDTCIVSELAKKNPNPSVLAWMEETGEDEIYFSVLTVAEVRRGIERLKDGDPHKAKLETWYRAMVPLLDQHAVPFDIDMAVEWGTIMGRSMCSGRPKPEIDMLIAATAKKRRLTLVTRNVKDMEGVGVELLNPFDLTATQQIC